MPAPPMMAAALLVTAMAAPTVPALVPTPPCLPLPTATGAPPSGGGCSMAPPASAAATVRAAIHVVRRNCNRPGHRRCRQQQEPYCHCRQQQQPCCRHRTGTHPRRFLPPPPQQPSWTASRAWSLRTRSIPTDPRPLRTCRRTAGRCWGWLRTKSSALPLPVVWIRRVVHRYLYRPRRSWDGSFRRTGLDFTKR